MKLKNRPRLQRGRMRSAIVSHLYHSIQITSHQQDLFLQHNPLHYCRYNVQDMLQDRADRIILNIVDLLHAI